MTKSKRNRLRAAGKSSKVGGKTVRPIGSTPKRKRPKLAVQAARLPQRERSDWSLGLIRILRDIQLRVPEFAHLQPERILVTAGQARKRSRATIRPYCFADTATRRSESGLLEKPLVKLGGKVIRYEIVLRPLFFLRSTPLERLRTLFHELFHLSPEFDGTLDETRRHTSMPRRQFDAKILPLMKHYALTAPSWVHDLLSTDGEVLVMQWLERPASRVRHKDSTAKTRFNEADLFLGPVLMKT